MTCGTIARRCRGCVHQAEVLLTSIRDEDQGRRLLLLHIASLHFHSLLLFFRSLTPSLRARFALCFCTFENHIYTGVFFSLCDCDVCVDGVGERERQSPAGSDQRQAHLHQQQRERARLAVRCPSLTLHSQTLCVISEDQSRSRMCLQEWPFKKEAGREESLRGWTDERKVARVPRTRDVT